MRNLELDLLRIISAYFIIFFHYTFRGWAADGFSNIRYETLGEIFRYGYCGLYAFFLMSGYFIVPAMEYRSFRDFWKARISRLLSIYWISLCIITMLLNLLGNSFYHISLKQFIISFFLLNSFFHIKYVDGTHWFLIYLFKFYIFCSFFCLLRKKISLTLWMIIGLFIHLIITFNTVPGLSFIFDRYFFIFFLSGMIFRLLRGKFDLSILFFIFFAFLACCYSAISFGNNQVNHYHVSFSIYVLCGIVIFLFLFFILIEFNVFQHFHSSKILAGISLITYPLYLIHHNLGFVIINKLKNYFTNYEILMITVVIITIMAWIIQFRIYPLTLKAIRKLERD